MSLAKRGAATLVAGASLSVLVALPASAATQQSGLVNVNAENTTVQVPIGVAANVCDVAANVLASNLTNAGAPCTALADDSANNTVTPAGNTRQQGLVNLNLQDTTVQLPVGIAANVCNVAVNALAQQLQNGAATCDATATSTGTNG